jgi:hypothetical protein
LTLMLFPTSKPGFVADAESPAQTIANVDVVTVSPVFADLYSFRLSPSLDQYSHATSGAVLLMTKSGELGSFAWPYWLLIDVLPSGIIGGLVLGAQRPRVKRT